MVSTYYKQLAMHCTIFAFKKFSLSLTHTRMHMKRGNHSSRLSFLFISFLPLFASPFYTIKKKKERKQRKSKQTKQKHNSHYKTTRLSARNLTYIITF